MTYNTGAKKKTKFCPHCLNEIVSKTCSVCGAYVAESDSIDFQELREIRKSFKQE